MRLPGAITEPFERLTDALRADDELRSRVIRFGSIGGGSLLVIAGLVTFLALRPVPKPDFEDDPIDEVFNFALLTDEFNKLSVEERLELVRLMGSRLRNLGGSESTLLAAFAAGIVGSAREQLEDNAATLILDLWDQQALDYPSVSDEERVAFLEQTIVEMTRLTEGLNGFPSDLNDDQILDRAREQAQRDAERFRSVSGQRGAAFGRMFSFLDEELGTRATPVQRGRIGLLARDLTRHLRGQDIGGN